MILMELKSDVANPTHDARKRSGIGSIKEFEAGERFVLCSVSTGGLWIRFYRHEGIETGDTGLIAALLADAKPSQASAFADIAATAAPGEGSPVTAADVLDAMMADKLVSDSTIRGIFDRIAAGRADLHEKAQEEVAAPRRSRASVALEKAAKGKSADKEKEASPA